MFRAIDHHFTFFYNGGNLSIPGSLTALNPEQFQQQIPLPDWLASAKPAKMGDYPVWIGNHRDALPSDWLNENVSFIVSLAEFTPTGTHKHLFWPMQQPHPPEDFHTVARVINQLVERGEKVLVHCYGGRDRSATTVLTWLVDHKGMKPQEARDFIIKHRPVTNPHLEWMGWQ